MSCAPMKQKVLGCLLGGLIGDAMGAPVEGWDYARIVSEKGWIRDFEGSGTDDSILKMILCEALIENKGHITADEFAAGLVGHARDYNWFFVPVKNAYHKLADHHDLPVNAGYGNTASSSSAMSISPVGIVNACDPRTAAAEAYEIAGLLHSGCCSFCRDAASAIAAAVAEAFSPGATVESVIGASVAYLHPQSGAQMIALIRAAQDMARAAGGYEAFRRDYCRKSVLYHAISDSRETVPVALALFRLSGGDVRRAVEYGANFGRDADTIATMTGALAGAFSGTERLPASWLTRLLENGRQDALANDLLSLIRVRYGEKRALLARLDAAWPDVANGAP